MYSVDEVPYRFRMFTKYLVTSHLLILHLNQSVKVSIVLDKGHINHSMIILETHSISLWKQYSMFIVRRIAWTPEQWN
jgi:hypothetical protein